LFDPLPCLVFMLRPRLCFFCFRFSFVRPPFGIPGPRFFALFFPVLPGDRGPFFFSFPWLIWLYGLLSFAFCSFLECMIFPLPVLPPFETPVVMMDSVFRVNRFPRHWDPWNNRFPFAPPLFLRSRVHTPRVQEPIRLALPTPFFSLFVSLAPVLLPGVFFFFFFLVSLPLVSSFGFCRIVSFWVVFHPSLRDGFFSVGFFR